MLFYVTYMGINKCVHKWKKIYYRKLVKGIDYQVWRTISNTYICEKCLEIKKLK